MTTDEANCTRPAEYSQELAMQIHDRLVEGQSLRTICADPVMPDRATVSEWLAQRPRFRDICRMARESCAYLLMDDALEIVDDRVM
jgi:Bacteriophage Sf6, terminase small subunit-like